MLGDDGKQPLPRFPEEWGGGCGGEGREHSLLSATQESGTRGERDAEPQTAHRRSWGTMRRLPILLLAFATGYMEGHCIWKANVLCLN